MMQMIKRKGAGALMALGIIAATALTAGLAQAASGNGPYYAEPSWSQKLPATTRFVVLTDWNSEAVLDRETGLVWEKSPAARLTNWNDARFRCVGRTTGGRTGWRLPSVHELASLIDPSVPFPGLALPPGHPFTNVQTLYYWAASTRADDPSEAWVVLFQPLVISFNKTVSNFFWCVRGGMNADVY